MSDSPAARPIWLTADEIYERDDLRVICQERYDAAPADATEAAADAYHAYADKGHPHRSVEGLLRAVLAALGAPK